MSDSSEIETAFRALSDQLHEGLTTADARALLVQQAVQVVPGCDHAAMSLRVRERLKTVAASDDIARQIDNLQLATGDGPCLDIITSEAAEHHVDLSTLPSPSGFQRQVLRQTPVRGMLAFRLVDQGNKRGALNLFADKPHAFTGNAIELAAVFAAYAAALLEATNQREQADTLREGLQSNREIGKAIGLLMATHNVSEPQAFDILRQASNELHRKLKDVAAEYSNQVLKTSASPRGRRP